VLRVADEDQLSLLLVVINQIKKALSLLSSVPPLFVN
jgi:hypothetical protein